MQVFFEIHSGLPREGPGDTRSTLKALSLLSDLKKIPQMADIGCGPGMQTLDLLDATDGTIVAVDNHQPFLDQLAASAARRGVADRLQIVNADMATLDFEPQSFDLIWSEGAAYCMGFENALKAWKPLLARRGALAVTEISWTKPDRPEEVQRFFDDEYPPMQDIAGNLAAFERAGYSEVGHFVLPESAWWDHYYIPIGKKLPEFREKYKNDAEALGAVELHDLEIEMYRKYSDCYGYVFYVMSLG